RLLREGKASDAAREFEQALEKEQRLSTYVDLYAALIEEPQRLVSAMEGATRVFARAPRAWLLLGDARRNAGDAAGARAAYEHALALGDGMPEARVRIAALHRDAREYDKGKAEGEKAPAAMSRRSGAAAAAAYPGLGRIQEEGARDLAAAFDSYAKALGAWENPAPAYFHIGRLSARHGSASQRRQAIESLETYLRLDANGEMAAEARRLRATLRCEAPKRREPPSLGPPWAARESPRQRPGPRAERPRRRMRASEVVLLLEVHPHVVVAEAVLLVEELLFLEQFGVLVEE